jgi:hypothetical protein
MSTIRAAVTVLVLAAPIAAEQSQPSYQPSFQAPATPYLPQSSYPAGGSFSPSAPPGYTAQPVGCSYTGRC